MRKGDYISTSLGIRMYPLDPREDEIDINDIANALSRICRFTGHVKPTVELYSVAEHCVRVAMYLPEPLRLAGLLHDASEAYLSDIARPVKKQPEFLKYKDIEHALETVIFKKFGVAINSYVVGEIHHADSKLLATEMRDVTNFPEVDRQNLPEPLHQTIIPWNTSKAIAKFLALFHELTEERFL